ncbi:lipoyl(octanoyl) transferase LipB [Legionella sp. D16C41]|uniref:lipoyl(octanoyl) transferase LipB n=1 Tax=Legionella sp. D16C41 TaxID=3402688 RepID=UPI003AF78536
MIVRQLGQQDYLATWEKMKHFTISRTPNTNDECWLLEHPPVYTQGQAGKAEHIINPKGIPLIQSDRGGQVTYHGPGQIVAYLLMDLQQRNLGIRTLVSQLEQILILLLSEYNILGTTREKAPGVYVDNKKIASIGLRVKNGCTYHGIALNVKMDLTPFAGINPCGFAKLQMTQIYDYVPDINFADVNNKLAALFSESFNN